jgi:hypothetical protein
MRIHSFLLIMTLTCLVPMVCIMPWRNLQWSNYEFHAVCMVGTMLVALATAWALDSWLRRFELIAGIKALIAWGLHLLSFLMTLVCIQNLERSVHCTISGDGGGSPVLFFWLSIVAGFLVLLIAFCHSLLRFLFR